MHVTARIPGIVLLLAVSSDREVLFEGDRDSMAALADAIAAGHSVTVSDDRDGQATVEVHPSPSRVVIEYCDTGIRVTGDTQHRSALSESLRRLTRHPKPESSEPPPHLHLEWHPEHPWLDHSSIPAVAELR